MSDRAGSMGGRGRRVGDVSWKGWQWVLGELGAGKGGKGFRGGWGEL